MNNTDKSQNGNCSNFQERIFALIEDGNQLNSDPEVINHLTFCSYCQKYLEKLTLFKSKLQGSPSTGLKPDSKIIKNIITYKNIKKGFQRIKPNTFWESIRLLFEFRIPLYQALSGAVVVFMLFTYISGHFLSAGSRTPTIDYSENQTGVSSSELYLLDTLNLSNPERGQNAKEDSVLIRFLVSTM
jgi:hypothetical protein